MTKHTWVVICILIGMIAGGLLYRHFAQEVDSRGATRLMRAIEENDAEKMDKFLYAGDVNVRDKSGQTALFYAARYATDPKTVYQLIVAGADPFLTDKQGRTVLITAAEYNPSVPVVMALTKQGLRQPEQHQQNMDEALVRAIKHNVAPVIKALLIANARPGTGPVAEQLAGNERLTEQEKTDYRQAMLVLEILDAREQFLKNYQGMDKSKVASQKPKQTSTKKPAAAKVAAPKKDVKNAPEKAAVPEEKSVSVEEKPAAVKQKATASVPQEKQMDEAK